MTQMDAKSDVYGLVFTSDVSISTSNTRRRIYLLLISVYCSNKKRPINNKLPSLRMLFVLMLASIVKSRLIRRER